MNKRARKALGGLGILAFLTAYVVVAVTVAGYLPDNTLAGYERAIEWKTSSHRRQAQRLVAEARRMMATGYRDLLKGSMRPALDSDDCDTAATVR